MSLPRRSLGLLALVIMLVLSACSSAAPPAATVGADGITNDQLSRDIAVFRFLSAVNQQSCGQPIADETAQSACARFTLSTLIQEDVVKAYARDHNISVSDAEVTSAVSQFTSSLGQSLAPQLAAQHLTQADVAGIVRRLLLFSDVEKAVGAGSVTDAQLRKLYEQQRAQFTQIHAKHILVKTQAEANRIEQQVTAQNFGRLAQKYSIDPGSAAKGGDLGTLSTSQLDATFVQAAEALHPGQISQPVQTQYGWHIIQLVSIGVPPLAQVRDQLIGPLQARAYSDWLHKQYTSLAISVNPRYGRFDPSSGTVVPVRSTATTPATPTATPSASATP